MPNVYEVITDRIIKQLEAGVAPLGGGNLISNSLAGHLSLKLREGKKNVQRKPSHRC
jgi:antirestriction protein ArdC